MAGVFLVKGSDGIIRDLASAQLWFRHRGPSLVPKRAGFPGGFPGRGRDDDR